MIGLIINPNSRKNKRRRGRVARFQKVLGRHGRVVETPSVDAVIPALKSFAEEGRRIWIADGGDGALHWMVNEAVRYFGAARAAELAVYLPTGGGSVDFVAKHLGFDLDPHALVTRLVEHVSTGREVPTRDVPSLWLRGRQVQWGDESVDFRRIGFGTALAGYGANFFGPLYEGGKEYGPARIAKLLGAAFGVAAMGSLFQGPLRVVKPDALRDAEHAFLRPLRAAVLVVLGAVTLSSLAWSIVVTAQSPTGAYFSTAARAWELGIGGLAATLVWGRVPRLGRWATEALLALGLAMIAYATLRFDEQTAVPGSAALVPVLGAALMLAAGSTTGASSTYLFRLLSLPPARVVGDWSYSLYLWHFPVLRLCQEYWEEPRLSRPHLLLALVLVLALSAATYHLVEQPFRKGVRWRPRARAIALYPVSLALVVVTSFGAHTWVDGQLAALEDNPGITVSDYAQDGLSGDPAVALVEASVLAAEEGRPVPGGLEPALGAVRESVAPLGDCDYRTGTQQLCAFGDPEAERSIVVTGDSHARHWSPALAEIGERYGYAVYVLVYSGCPATAVTRPTDSGRAWSECADFKQWVLDQVRELRPELVVVSNNAYRSSFMRPRQVEGLKDQLRLLAPLAERVAMIGNSPKLPRAPGTCLSSRGVDLSDCLQQPEEPDTRIQGDFRRTTESLGMTYVDARKWFCAEQGCPGVIGRVVPMRDREHVTLEYSRQLAEPIAAALGIAR